MAEKNVVLDLQKKIDNLTEEAKDIQKRYATSQESERTQLEFRYSELEQELKDIKRQIRESKYDPPQKVLDGKSSSGSGPFGISMGMCLEDLDICTDSELSPGKYRLNSVPKPHTAFESYIVQTSRSYGVSWIKAIGKDIPTSSDGVALRIAFEEMASRLEKVYGADFESTDLLVSGSIWNEMLDWMMGLLKGERVFARQWGVESGAKLPNGLTSIFLHASATDRETGYIGIEYSFLNSEVSDAEIKAEEDDAL